jgi:hypothetical protein
VALTDDLKIYLQLDEASGNALDSHSVGPYDLTENGTIGSVSGRRHLQRANSEYFSRASNADLQSGDIEFSVAAWVNAETVAGGYFTIAAKDNITVEREWILLIDQDVAEKFSFSVFSGTTSRGAVQWGTPPSISTLYFVAAGHSASGDLVWISVNAGTPVTSGTSGTPAVSSADFLVGAAKVGGSPNLFWDGQVGTLGYWKRDIRTDLTTLYNGGTPLTYAELGGGTPTIAMVVPRRGRRLRAHNLTR